VKRVLITDDDNDIRESLAELFEESYQVLVASNGVEALAILAREHVDAIVLDLMMPIMDGETFLKELHERKQTVPVVVLSASRDLARRAQTLGVAGYCSKPCPVDKLLAEVARVLGNPSDGGEQDSGGQAPQTPQTPPSSSSTARRSSRHQPDAARLALRPSPRAPADQALFRIGTLSSPTVTTSVAP
jgi:DNA-binding response OmpR family regulator